MSRSARYTLWFLLSGIPLLAGIDSLASPESDAIELSRRLKGISDNDWDGIAGARGSERYDIIKGDTLYGISGRLFGDSKYWPKIWEINNRSILNPHFIYPGQSLVFHAGSSSDLPSVELGQEGAAPAAPVASSDGTQVFEEESENASVNPADQTSTEIIRTSLSSASDRPGPVWDERTPKPKTEWKKLPRQAWENTNSIQAPTVDKNGFDYRNKQKIRRSTGFELDYYLACGDLQPVGQVTHSRNLTEFLNLNDEVSISASQEIQIGKRYSLIGQGVSISSGDRSITSYLITGATKILGVNDGIYLGEMKQIRNQPERGNFVLDFPSRIQRLNPVAGPSPIEGKILLDTRFTPNMSAQYKWVYIDRGSDDGVQPGMIFRIFQHQDPFNGEEISASNMLVQGDVEIYQTCGQFSLGQIIWSRGPVQNKALSILLTDVQDYYTRLYLNGNTTPLQLQQSMPSEETPPEAPAEPTPANKDWLDELDNGDDLTNAEDEELKQLEGVPEENTTPEDPTAAPTVPGEEGLQPAPTEELPPAEAPPTAEPLPAEQAPAATPEPAAPADSYPAEELPPVAEPAPPPAAEPEAPPPQTPPPADEGGDAPV